MGPIGYPETLRNKFHSTMRNISVDRKRQFNRRGSLNYPKDTAFSESYILITRKVLEYFNSMSL